MKERGKVLEGLQKIGLLGSKAEAIETAQLLKSTWLVPKHTSFLDSDILLIIGGRGVGKSHLFRLINIVEGQALLAQNKRRLANSIWLRGYQASGNEFPGETVLQRFADDKNGADLLDFWRGLLLGVILKQVEPELTHFLRANLPESLVNALGNLTTVSTWHREVVAHLEQVETVLYQLDEFLEREKRFLFATYDDLDVMTVAWSEKRALIQALLQFWLGQWRRWTRIRPKIFLRSDLFSDQILKFPDASKLTGNKIELHWSYLQLYQLAFKSWANQNEASCLFLKQAGLDLIQDGRLGWTYQSEPLEKSLQGVVQQMMGPYMGSGVTKGRTFEWIPNHLQDTKGEIVPRSILNLLSLAADDELKNRRVSPESTLLLSPLSIRQAMEEVSARRVVELAEEYPWLDIIKPKLFDRQVPMTQEDFVGLLLELDWDQVEPTRRPPSQLPAKIMEELLRLGVLRRTYDQRIHVPDIYLYGLGLKRKGGIGRPK